MAREDRFATLFQALVVEREHHMESFAIGGGEGHGQHVLVERPVVGVDEAVLVPLEAGDFVGAPADFEPRANPHRVVGMPVRDVGASPSDAIGGLLFNAEQEIEDRRRGRRLARLVEAVDDMKVRAAGRRGAEVELIIAEPSVAREIEAADPHAARSRSEARKWASTSSAPSRATARSIAANSPGSRPTSPSWEPCGRLRLNSSAISRRGS